jgi:hypothetical protein
MAEPVKARAPQQRLVVIRDLIVAQNDKNFEIAPNDTVAFRAEGQDCYLQFDAMPASILLAVAQAGHDADMVLQPSTANVDILWKVLAAPISTTMKPAIAKASPAPADPPNTIHVGSGGR